MNMNIFYHFWSQKSNNQNYKTSLAHHTLTMFTVKIKPIFTFKLHLITKPTREITLLFYVLSCSEPNKWNDYVTAEQLWTADYFPCHCVAGLAWPDHRISQASPSHTDTPMFLPPSSHWLILGCLESLIFHLDWRMDHFYPNLFSLL